MKADYFPVFYQVFFFFFARKIETSNLLHVFLSLDFSAIQTLIVLSQILLNYQTLIEEKKQKKQNKI